MYSDVARRAVDETGHGVVHVPATCFRRPFVLSIAVIPSMPIIIVADSRVVVGTVGSRNTFFSPRQRPRISYIR